MAVPEVAITSKWKAAARKAAVRRLRRLGPFSLALRGFQEIHHAQIVALYEILGVMLSSLEERSELGGA